MSCEMANARLASNLPKRRACDECRLRKIACSKQPDGCCRCTKEGIPCVYSPQKPMGRPRKRRHLEESSSQCTAKDSGSEASSVTAATEAAAQSHEPPPELPEVITATSYDDAAIMPFLSTEPTLDFLDHHDESDLSFLDLLPDFDANESLFSMPSFGQMPFDSFTFSSMPMNSTDLLDGINFDEDPSAATISKDIRDSLQRFVELQYSQPPAFTEPSPNIQSHYFEPQGTPITTAAPTLKPDLNTDCACLSSIYYAISALTNLPSDIPSAMRVTRHASRTAHSVISCPNCFDIFYVDPTKPPPIQCFQNLMLFGALLPSACNAYSAILAMVDYETERAKEENCRIWFSFTEVSDVRDGITDDALAACDIARVYHNRYLEPDIWRATIRTILRVDVYGFDESISPPSPSSDGRCIPQRGLKEVITLMDEKHRRRHEVFDALIESGQVPPATLRVLFPQDRGECTPEESNCDRVFESARLALSNLVIA